MASIRLLDLPLEVIRIICKHLCLHCTSYGIDNSVEPDYHIWDRKLDKFVVRDVEASLAAKGILPPEAADARPEEIQTKLALHNLCRTCKLLRDISQPYLYHCLTTFHCVPPLMRTLVKRPDLSNQILELEVSQLRWRVPKRLSPADVELFTEATPPWAEDPDSNSNDEFWRYKRQYKDSSKKSQIQNSALVVLLLSRVPNLERLRLELDRSSWLLLLPDFPPRHFSQLKFIEYASTPEHHVCLIASIAEILKAAPNLEVFDVYGLYTVEYEGTTPATRTYIRFDYRAQGLLQSDTQKEENEGELPTRNNGQPVSTKFGLAYPVKYGGRGRRGRGSTVFRIGREAARLVYRSNEGMSISNEDISYAHSMELLQLLTDKMLSPNQYLNNLCLSDLLPRSIRRVGLLSPVLFFHGRSFDLVRQAEDKDRFPNLKEVMVRGFPEQANDMYREAFQKLGIEFVGGRIWPEYAPLPLGSPE